ncbi:MAG TPA: NAD-dependent epimerase/dehydratase family protein [Luteimonas sp.]|nr:NAD-dependent epimerase/dehydratase family protein [Luteimonas sp.]
MRVLIAGATGLVGQGVLEETLADPSVEKIALLLRHAVDREDARLQPLIVADFADLSAVETRMAPYDACFYCAGATPVGTPENEYRRVTLDLTLHVARTYAQRNPKGRFLYVSGAGSNPDSRIMQLRIKGETEQALRSLPIATTMLRTGGIQPVHGETSPHAWLKPLYAIGGPLMGLGVRMAPAVLTTTAAVGRAMLALAKMADPPPVVENAEINRLGADA